MNGWIKIHRKIQQWTWWRHPHTLQLFIYLLLNANNEQQQCGKIYVQRGELLTSRRTISRNTGMSEQQVRTAMAHLVSTDEIKLRTTNKYTLITICKYDEYQANNTAKKKGAPSKTFSRPSSEDIAAYCRQRMNNIDAAQFFDYYESTGWHIGKYPMKDWKATIRMWERKNNKENPGTVKHYQGKRYERF